MIALPVILDNRGDVTLYDSIEAAERMAEPIDVRKGEYVVYDASGRVLNITVEHRQGRERTRITELHPEQLATEKLRARLIRCLVAIGSLAKTDLESRSLGELIELGREFSSGPVS